ncbi:MAG: phosphoglucomutase/phosphomannomutase family protein [Thermostichales cyanobacterium HHBFW_bins_127]
MGIKFGTDGWRAVIADEFTFANVARVAQASARVLQTTYPGEGIVIGYDHRFLAEEFAHHAATTVSQLGIPVILAAVAAPTPAFSWAAKQLGCHGALVLTASHNPPQYLGIKVKGGFGGSVPPEVTRQIEQALHHITPQSGPSRDPHRLDPWPSYLQQLASQVDLRTILASPATMWADAMHGSAGGGMGMLLKKRIIGLRDDRDPLFGGMAPEPLPPQLATTMAVIAQDPAPLKVGVVFDGDGDRIAAIDGQGNFLSPQILIPILIDHLYRRRGKSGEIVKTVSGSQLIDRLAQHLGLPVTETPIGFKYIAERMLQTQVLLGGEESGGIGYANHMPERDAMLSALLLLEAVAMTGQDLSHLYQNLQREMGFQSVYLRRDLHLRDPQQQQRVLAVLQQQPLSRIGERAVVGVDHRDGYKFWLAGQGWLMLRGSGTEPLLRLYCEAEDLETVQTLLDWTVTWIHQFS